MAPTRRTLEGEMGAPTLALTLWTCSVRQCPSAALKVQRPYFSAPSLPLFIHSPFMRTHAHMHPTHAGSQGIAASPMRLGDNSTEHVREVKPGAMHLVAKREQSLWLLPPHAALAARPHEDVVHPPRPTLQANPATRQRPVRPCLQVSLRLCRPRMDCEAACTRFPLHSPTRNLPSLIPTHSDGASLHVREHTGVPPTHGRSSRPHLLMP